MYFLIDLLSGTIEITLKYVVRFLVACLVSGLLNDKDNSYLPSCLIYFNDVTNREEFITLAVSCLNPHEIFQKLFN